MKTMKTGTQTGLSGRMNRGIATGLAIVGLSAGLALGAENSIVVDGSTTVGPIAKAFRGYYEGKNPGVKISVSESGSGNGAKSLINGTCDVATLSRPMKSSEKKSAKDAGIMAVEHIVAMDGIAVVVHPSNPVGALTVEQVRSIYAGQIKNWKELGGPDKPIVVISRETNSGTYETFEGMVMVKEKMAGHVEYVGSNGAIRDRVRSTESAVGYVGLAFMDGVKVVTVNGVEPTMETVKSAKYPVSRPLYMYTNGNPKEGSHLYKFVKLYATLEGRKLVEEAGFVPVDERK